jgi:hypothetical protein
MIETKMEYERVGHSSEQQLGEAWIQAIADRKLDRLAGFCSPRLSSRLLLPSGLATVDGAADLVARYMDWFGSYTTIQVEASRISPIGSKLGIFYRLLLKDGEASERIEQQLYCILKDGYVAQLHLVCSGFHPVYANERAA